jgi:hypothetical protein
MIENIMAGLFGIFLILGFIVIGTHILSWIYFKFIRKNDYHLHYRFTKKLENILGGSQVILLIFFSIGILFLSIDQLTPKKKQVSYSINDIKELKIYKESRAIELENYRYRAEQEKEERKKFQDEQLRRLESLSRPK